MSKGKLYEEIWDSIEDLTVTELLEEAKKEFPSLPVINGFSDKEIVEIVDFWANANIWFWRWFGSEEETPNE